MATQVQIRGAASGTQNARTLVTRELDYDTTNDRLSPHDGSTAGGIPHINYLDQQRNTFNYVAVTGTNALTGSLSKSPSAYQVGQAFFIKTANTNTGAVTLNLNTLGAKTLKKIFNGALTDLAAGDIISGQMLHVLYDGTYFQVLSGSGSEFGEQSWIPSGVTSYTAAECVYVEYGDSVTVSFEVTMTSDSTIDNVPFAPNQLVYFICHNTAGSTSGSFATANSDAQFVGWLSGTTINIGHTAASDGDTIRGVLTYIKA